MQELPTDESSLEPFRALLGEVECGDEFSLANPDHAAWLTWRLRCHVSQGACFAGQRDERGRAEGIVGILLPNWPQLRHMPRVAELTHLGVAAGVRRCGLGTQLVRHAERSAASRGSASVYVRTAAVNRAAVALYEALGYVLTAELPDVYGRAAGADLLYRKVL